MSIATRQLPLPSADRSRPVASDIHAELEAIYDAHADFVRRNVRRLGISEAFADDVVQKVFLVAARRLADFEHRSSVKTWLFSILIRVVQEERRSIRRRLQHWLRGDNADPDELPFAEGRTSFDMMSQAEACLVVQRLLDTLEPKKREVFVLVELEEMSAKEVAEITGLGVPRVYSILRAARTDFEQAASRLRREERFGP